MVEEATVTQGIDFEKLNSQSNFNIISKIFHFKKWFLTSSDTLFSSCARRVLFLPSRIRQVTLADK